MSAGLFGSGTTHGALLDEADAYVVRARTMLRRAHVLIMADRVGSNALMARHRDRLTAHLRRYQRFKHERIFDPVLRHGLASSRIVARRMKLDCYQLGETITAYHARWRYLSAAEWPAHRADMLLIAGIIERSMQAELRAIRQLLMISTHYAA